MIQDTKDTHSSQEAYTSPPLENQPLAEIDNNGKKILLLGTAHISSQSVEAVKQMIQTLNPDCVAVELDSSRLKTLQNKAGFAELDIITVLKKNQGLLLLCNLILAGIQKKMGKTLGIKPGDEMAGALDLAKQKNIDIALVDRPVQTTLLRAWNKTPAFSKVSLISSLIAGSFFNGDVTKEQIESLKQKNEMDSMMQELTNAMPHLKEVLIDERDAFLAQKIFDASSTHSLTFAVLGAGHLKGVQKNLKSLITGEKSFDTQALCQVPKKSATKKVFMWGIPILLIALIVAGFVAGGVQMGKKMIGSWVLWNGLLAGIGSLVALGHPLAFLASVIGSPFTSLCPFVGVGMVSGFVQAVVAKPKVKDLENLSDDATCIKGFYKNRLLKVLLVFLFSSIGSSIGTFVAGASFLKAISSVFDKLLQAIGLM